MDIPVEEQVAMKGEALTNLNTNVEGVFDRTLSRVATFAERRYDRLNTILGKEEEDAEERRRNRQQMTSKNIINLTGSPVESSFPEIDVSTQGFYAYLIKSAAPMHLEGSEEGEPAQGYTVRRPIIGSSQKENLPAHIFLNDAGAATPTASNVLSSSTKSTKLYNSIKSSEPVDKVTFNFLVESMAHTYAENSQMVQTFGKTYFFFFGQRPTVLNVSGILLNTQDFTWRNDFLANYQQFLRGTKAAIAGKEVVLMVDELIFTGYMMSLNIREDAELRDIAQFAFDMVVTKVSITPPYYVSGKTAHDFESSVDGSNLTREYYEYIGPYGSATKDGRKEEPKTIYVYQGFADALSRYIGFNLRSINRIQTMQGYLSGGGMKNLINLGLVSWSTAAQRRGAHVFELDRIFSTPASELL